MMSDVTIVEFLRARLDEDEATARAILADDLSEGRWRWQLHGLNPYRTALVNDRGSVLLPAKHDDVFPSRSVAEHIARHDPARVLREVEAKRRIVDLHEQWPVLVETQSTLEPVPDDPTSFAYRVSQQIAWTTQQRYRETFGDEPPTAPMIAALASVYSDHPDYRDEWE